MTCLPRLKPVTAAIRSAEFATAVPHTRRIASGSSALLPLGAMVAALAFSVNNASAQQTAPTEAKALPSIEVKAKPEEKGYQGAKTNVGKTPQLLRDIPQSVTVITEQLIQDRGADTLKDALRNVAGLTFNAGEGGRIGDNVTLRGYSLVGDLYLDGMRDIAQYNREIFNVEQVDVLRGSASMLFGRGSTGGVVNQVSKKPFTYNLNEAAVTFGTDHYKRATADLNKVVGENAAIRVNIMKTDTGSFRDGVQNERWGIAPSFSWGIGTKDEFNLSYYRLKGDAVPDMGVPYFQGKPLNVPVNTFYGMPNTDFQREDTAMSTASWIHRFDNDTSLKTVLRKADYDRDLWAVAPRLGTLAGTTCTINNNLTSFTSSTAVCRQAQRRGGTEHTLTSQTDFITKLDAGGFKHELLAGLELVKEDANRWNYNTLPANPATTVGSPNLFPGLPSGYGDMTRISPVSYSANTVGLYAQDMITLAPKWKLLIGARHDDFKADYQRTAPAGPLSRTDRVWSYRTGLLYQPTDASSYYVSYGTSYNPSGELYALDTAGANTPPEKNRNIELGAKWDLLDGNLMFRTAVFRSEKSNERNTDLANTSLTENLLTGRRHTDGVEFEMAGRITPRWEIFGGLALMKASIDEATLDQRNQIGMTPINTPKYTANIWSTYKLTEQWKIGGGVEAVGERNANLPNATNTTVLNVVPSYVRWDGMLEYAVEKYSIKLNVFNLFNQKYYEGVYAGHSVPGTTRTAQLTLSTKF